VDVSIRPGWFYHAKEDSLVKTPEKLFNIYLTSIGRGSNLLLNVPPNRDGVFHPNDVKALQGFRRLLDKAFGNNLAAKAAVKVSSVRGNDATYEGSKLTDGDKNTYWATDDDITSGSVEIALHGMQTVRYIMLQEYIKLGQRVKSFTVEVQRGKDWKQVAEATTIGYKRILKIEPVTTDKVRITIKDSKACPVLSNIEVY
jgi:alpha-L-fucosidase